MDILITAKMDGMRIKHILLQEAGVSMTQLKSAKWNGGILCNQRPCTVRDTVHTGDIVRFLPPVTVPVYHPRPYPLPLSIPYEDPHILIVDKPAPLASQSSRNHPDDSLENALFSYFHEPEDYCYRPVNRLDKGTSGLMLVAKTPHAQHRCQQLLHTPQFVRRYTALATGYFSERKGTIRLPIAKEEGASVRRVVRSDGLPSVTHYEVILEGNGYSLLRLTLETGRTHQIRVHLSALGHPILGDFLYGTESPLCPGRFALHSSEILLTHPLGGQRLHILSPAPAAWQHLITEGEWIP